MYLRRIPVIITAGLAACLGLSILVGTASASTAVGHGSSGLSTAKAAVAAAEQPIAAFTAPGPTFNAKPATGKKVWFIGQSLDIPYTLSIEQAFATAMGDDHVSVQTCDGKNIPATIETCITTAIDQHPAAIVQEGASPSVFATGAATAKKDGIPFVAGDPAVDPAHPYLGIPGEVNNPYVAASKLMADWAIAATNGKANVLVMDSPDISQSVTMDSDIAAQVKALCSACHVWSTGAPGAEWATRLPGETSTELTQHPSINYIIPVYDSMIPLITPAVKQAGADSRVSVVSFNADLPEMQMLATNTIVAADLGNNLGYEGWALADSALRLMTHHTTNLHTTVPIRFFTRSSVKGLALTNAAVLSGQWYGAANQFETGFLKLWGLS